VVLRRITVFGPELTGLAGATSAGFSFTGRGGKFSVPAFTFSQKASVGQSFSSAQVSRWRTLARCASQQLTEQKAKNNRGRLQVETLQAQYLLGAPEAGEKGSAFLQELHFLQSI
jgi:hypothetical protein